MQTPPDSDQENWTCYGPFDDDDDDGDGGAGDEFDPDAVARRARQHYSLNAGKPVKSAALLTTAIIATSNHGRALVHKQRRAQRILPTPPIRENDNGSLSTYKPTTASTRLRTELVTMLHRTQRNGTWFDLLPARIGHSESVDCAAKAIVKAAELAECKTPITQDSCLGSYARAISSLQAGMLSSVSGDDMLLTVSLLVTFERIFAYTSVPLKSHMAGVVALLMAQMKTTNSKPPSELTRAVMYTFWPVAFIGPCVEGVASPFEAPRWLKAEPVVMTRDKLRTPWEVVAKLRKSGMELFIRLPRLIKMVKSILADPNPEDIDAAIALAKELLTMEDVEAESALLHHVTVSSSAADNSQLSRATLLVADSLYSTDQKHGRAFDRANNTLRHGLYHYRRVRSGRSLLVYPHPPLPHLLAIIRAVPSHVQSPGPLAKTTARSPNHSHGRECAHGFKLGCA
jgi:hypothetical protein